MKTKASTMNAAQHGVSIKAVFFDLDGTLLDSAPDFYVAMQQLWDEYQHPPVAEPIIRAAVSNGSAAVIAAGFDITEASSGFKTKQLRLLELYTECMGKNSALFDGMQELLQKIKEHGLFWGIITNKPARFTDPILDTITLPNHPNLVICPDHVSQTKPHPEPLLLACKKVGCTPEQVIYVGDHQRDIDCGIAAGSLTIAASFGYLANDDDINSWNADFIANTGHDIWPYVEARL